MITMHPGEYLRSALLEPLELTVSQVAVLMGVSKASVSRLVAGKSDLSAPMAVRLGLVFGNSAESWMAIQTKFDLERAKAELDQSTVTPYFYGLSKTSDQNKAIIGH
jgi:addiction module HigA family antidote